MCGAEGKEEKAEEGGEEDVGEEVAVVAAADAVVQPDAVMILSFDAGITHPAMVGAGWAPDVAGFAVLGRYFHCRGLRQAGFSAGVTAW